jgi:mannitol-1-/sugar-/sorbitol-6-phosphatase
LRLRAKALLFDNDGVLVDSHAAVHAAWDQWAIEYNLLDFDISNHYGTRAEDLVFELVGAEKFSLANDRINELEQLSANTTVALPGAVELVQSLPDGLWTICTSANPNLAKARIQAAGLPMPKALVTAADVQNGKPAPDPYLLGAKRLGFDASECIVFEDAPAGITAGISAGAGFVVGVGELALETPADLVIANLLGIKFDGDWLEIPDRSVLRS